VDKLRRSDTCDELESAAPRSWIFD